jgi:hypothetical protein
LKDLKPVAREALDAFEAIEGAASEMLTQRGLTLQSLAVVNEATAEAVAARMRDRNLARTSNLQELRRKPAIARLVIADEDDEHETIYVAPNAEVTVPGLKLCSYLNNAGKGKLASFSPGDGTNVKLSGGVRYFEVVEKLTFEPGCDSGEWDSRPAISFQPDGRAQTIRSLRALLQEAGVPDEEIDLMEQWASQSEEGANVTQGLVYTPRQALELKVASLLDKFQSEIFRLPLNEQIAVMGPPGTGKTTTMVMRLRQKLDFALLDEEERGLVEEPDAAGLEHPDSWILFTPSDSLRLYVAQALGKAGVPVHDDRLRTWDNYRLDVARNVLRILRTGTSPGLTIRNDGALLASGALRNQIAWFEDFDVWQQELFVRQIAVEADRLKKAEDPRAVALGRRIEEAVARAGDKILQLLGELAGQAEALTTYAGGMSEAIRKGLAAPGNRFAGSDPGFLDALIKVAVELQQQGAEVADADDDEDPDDDEVPEHTADERQLALNIFRRAMRTIAIGQASGRKPGERSRAARIAALVSERGHELPDLSETGRALLLQRAARRLARAPAAYLASVPLRYRRFRRVMRAEGRWYGEAPEMAQIAHPAEVDLIMLSMLRAARAFEQDRLLTTRLGERRPPMLDAIARLRRNQVLVDEMTDFSPLQLAAMAALAAPPTSSLFLSGDFNQRLTTVGIRDAMELRWASPTLDVHTISISYRQSRKLAAYAKTLARLQGSHVHEDAPEYGENEGVLPVVECNLDTPAKSAAWLAKRIVEIERLTQGQFPTIAVLVADKRAADDLAPALGNELLAMNLKAKAYSSGDAIGQSNEVRIFPVGDIKGLEFEAVFFIDVDHLAEGEPDLFDRYIYVGSTRAATFLGLTTSGPAPPATLAHTDLVYGRSW